MVLRTFLKAIGEKEIRNKLLWTCAILFVYRLGAHITVPGVNAGAMTDLMNQSSLLGVLNMLAGGGMSQYSLFALGVSPYVTAQIVVQLLQMDIVPRFVEWSKQGETGRRHLNQATRWLTIIVAFAQSIGITAGLNAMNSGADLGLLRSNSWQNYVLIAAIMAIGTMFATWLGDQITDRGLGNGSSMIIFSGIVAQIWPGLGQSFKEYLIEDGSLTSWVQILVLLTALLLTVAVVTYFYDAIRRVKIQYTRSANNYGEQAYLPLRLNVSGVIPVIFASSFITTPQTLLTAFADSWQQYSWYQPATEIFNMQTLKGAIMYALLIILFTYFYAFVQVNPEKTSDNLQKQGAYIVGVRPGDSTKDFIAGLLNRLSGVGSLFLAGVSVIPLLAQATGLIESDQRLALGGTSLLISIGVAIDIMRQIYGLMQKRNYVGFIRGEKPATK